MIHEFDVVALTAPLSDRGLVAGDTGAVVDVHRDAEGMPDGFTVEIIRGGRTVAVVPLVPDQIRLVRHYRPARTPNTAKV